MKTQLLACWAAAIALLATSAGAQAQSFGTLESTPPDAVQAKALTWLKAATNGDAGKLREAEALWARPDRTPLDNLADTFALGSKDAAELLKVVRDPLAPPPVGVPDILKNDKTDAFFRANLGLAVARHLSNRRVHEEALAILRAISPEQTVDPSAYLFHRAVAEHALLLREDAGRTIARLIQDAADCPDRYKTVAALMMLDMQTWKKDLGNVSRLMNNSERRLEVGRGGPETQKIQKEIIRRLDELIKELENKVNPPGDQPGTPTDKGDNKNTRPLDQPRIITTPGSGNVDIARLNKLAGGWGKMSPAERIRAMQEVQDLIAGLSPIHREAFERYFEEINNQVPPQKRQ